MIVREFTERLGAEIEVSLPRDGTKCAFCGRKIASPDFIRLSRTAVQLNGAYVHEACARVSDDGERKGACDENMKPLPVVRGKATNNSWAIEVYPVTSTPCTIGPETLAYCAASYGFQFERCFDGLRGIAQGLVNLHGLKRRLAGLETVPRIAFRGNECRILWRSENMTPADFEAIYEGRDLILAPVNDFISSVFIVFGKGSKITVHRDFLELSVTYKSAAQVVFAAQCLIDIGAQIERLVSLKQGVEKTAEKAVKIAVKYEAGGADIQKPARNDGKEWSEIVSDFYH